ncbi:hypothetical protein LAV84_29900 [Rhizobium sp. VS19-DR104.2]|uniref:hypothetical protein n=1 Tax=unclassified Rhizobium TaxID=2613769 RepID=UPI001C5A6BD7|nr:MULTISPECIES: hypothetical protein [unclassified Rhizobium]MBZ5763679.1 hypothetical protein [Rhizobium sp. VS19-DR96]MBZ5769603.1 hypothetical protein [Rhizobium sp. VS19-DR129.2]MBZ5777032.1 hypothetical protein [Rhizobium sp. VS19-DRK62.2]MBZ5788113.1 hypothetical protein [Rhizobium sp. VS19-DR121]MBZ5805733.1 hypothetical protein [Rhizobium sp. VS19-DR181]
MTIAKPTRPPTDPQRFLDCQEALSPFVLKLIADAVDAEWSPIEATEAIIVLAEQDALHKGATVWINEMLLRFVTDPKS